MTKPFITTLTMQRHSAYNHDNAKDIIIDVRKRDVGNRR